MRSFATSFNRKRLLRSKSTLILKFVEHGPVRGGDARSRAHSSVFPLASSAAFQLAICALSGSLAASFKPSSTPAKHSTNRRASIRMHRAGRKSVKLFEVPV